MHYERRTGLGIMDIVLIYKNKKYIIETKVKRYPGTIDEALEQLTEKYLLPERVSHGYIVIFDPKTKVGELCIPQKHTVEGKDILRDSCQKQANSPIPDAHASGYHPLFL